MNDYGCATKDHARDSTLLQSHLMSSSKDLLQIDFQVWMERGEGRDQPTPRKTRRGVAGEILPDSAALTCLPPSLGCS